MTNQFVGVGWRFPLKTDETGGIELVADNEEVEESIRLILGTAYGERPMRPDFGCSIHDFVFAEADAGTAGRLAFEVRSSLRRWEPRIEVLGVDVTVDSDDRSVLYIDIRYVIRDTNDPRNLVFPFYVIPTDPGAEA